MLDDGSDRTFDTVTANDKDNNDAVGSHSDSSLEAKVNGIEGSGSTYNSDDG